MAKKTLEEMLKEPAPWDNKQAGEKKGRKKRNFSKKDKTKLAIYWSILVICLAGFIILLIFLLNNNPLERTRAEVQLPSCTYVAQSYTEPIPDILIQNR